MCTIAGHIPWYMMSVSKRSIHTNTNTHVNKYKKNYTKNSKPSIVTNANFVLVGHDGYS